MTDVTQVKQNDMVYVHNDDTQNVLKIIKSIGIVLMIVFIGMALWFGAMCMRYHHLTEGILIIVSFILISSLLLMIRFYNSSLIDDMAISKATGDCEKIIEGIMVFDNKQCFMQIALYKTSFQIPEVDDTGIDKTMVLNRLIPYTDITSLRKNEDNTSIYITFLDADKNPHTVTIESNKQLKIAAIYDIFESKCVMEHDENLEKKFSAS